MSGFIGRPDGAGRRRTAPGWRELHRAEVGLARPNYRILDVGSAPDAVRRRWAARQVRMSAGIPGRLYPESLLGRNVIASRAWVWGFGVATVLAEAGSSLVLVPSSLLGLMPAAGTGGALGGIAVIGGGATAVTGWRYWRDPKRLRRRERAAARAAMWITPAALGYRRAKALGRTTDEERLFHLAVHTAEGIVATNAWRSSLLDGHRVRLDLDENLSQIGRRLVHIRRLRDEMVAADGPATRRTIDGYRRSLDQAFDSIAGRVVALHGYLNQLRRLDGGLARLAQAEHAESLSDRVLDVLAATAADTTAAEQISELGVQAVDSAASVDQLLGELAETVSTFDSGAFAEFPAGADGPDSPDEPGSAGRKGDK
ncbi:hypothetical protein [Spelaeicoccus albus]|uniref:Uncharacterized protein n=1 Tax=Spelaeicoccus albus TaxID=1280376 RepID=A0A7Z0IHE2_9MICO|nr:hypothetical protein [Spelaeicoccus albus]NYI67654.1 hypothetical protein [Spelaeicoccus albus]